MKQCRSRCSDSLDAIERSIAAFAWLLFDATVEHPIAKKVIVRWNQNGLLSGTGSTRSVFGCSPPVEPRN